MPLDKLKSRSQSSSVVHILGWGNVAEGERRIDLDNIQTAMKVSFFE